MNVKGTILLCSTLAVVLGLLAALWQQSSGSHLIDNTSTSLDFPHEQFSVFLDFVLEVSNFHPSNQQTADSLHALQRIYSTALDRNCNLTLGQFQDIILNYSFSNIQHGAKYRIDNTIWVSFNLSAKIKTAFNFVKSVCHSVGLKRKVACKSQVHTPAVVVVGAGPTGLGNAIEAFTFGGDVTVFEKRDNYKRSLWLDLMSKPWSSVHEVLKRWGWSHQSLEAKIYTNPDVWTVRIQILERFLAKVAAMVGIPLHYQWEFLSICNSSHVAVHHALNLPPEFPCTTKDSIRQFDVLIGSDGAGSLVRHAAEIEYAHIEYFQFQNNTRIVPGIKQVTMIANFDPWKSHNGTCPELEVDSSGAVHSPWYPSFHIQGVNSVWKRFYFGHCQLQILFNNDLGEKIWSQYASHKSNSSSANDWENGAISWDYLLKVTNVLVQTPYSKEEIQESLLRKPNGEYDIQIFPVTIRKANPLTSVLSRYGTGDEKVTKHYSGILVLVGDASVTAHYRLGIGINNAFSSFHEVGELVLKLGNVPTKCWDGSIRDSECSDEILKIVERRESQAQQRVDKLVNFQLAAMYFESYCDYVVSYNVEKDMSEALEIFKRNNKRKRFDEILDKKILAQNCTL